MRKQFFLFFCIAIFYSAAFTQNTIDVLHYRYELELNDKNDSIYGKAAITVQFLQPTGRVSFDFIQLKNGKTIMKAVAYMQSNPKAALVVTSTPELLSLQLPQEVKAGDSVTLVIEYRGIPGDGLIISKNKYGRRTFFADNWPNRGRNWIPCIDDPADKASVEFIVTAPQHYQVVANGIQVEETNLPQNKKKTHWKEDVPIATKVMVIGLADFAVSLAGTINNCIPVYNWVYPEEREKGFYDYSLALDILPFFIDYIGPYGYKKLANVQSKTSFGGLENASTIFYHENSITGDRSAEALIAHEISHQWFGNMATEKSFAHLWLSEGFATYMTILYMEAKHGSDTTTKMLIEDREQIAAFAKTNNRPVVDTTKDYMQLLNPNSYQKGGWILHMLRHQLGDAVFKRAIRAYYKAYAGKNADTGDLQQIFQQAAGKDLSRFFKQWLYTPGIPVLQLEHSYHAASKTIDLTVSQLQGTPFHFPLEINIEEGNGKMRSTTITVSQQQQTFSIPSNGQPRAIIPDPAVKLLFAIEKETGK